MQYGFTDSADSGGVTDSNQSTAESNIDYSGSLLSIVRNVIGIAEKITQLPALIADKLGLDTLFSNLQSALLSKLVDLGSNILSLPSAIGEFVTDMRDALVEKLTSVIDNITSLPGKIVDDIKGLFVPSDGFVESKVNELASELQGLGVNTYDMSNIFSSEQPFKNITVNMYGHEVVIVDMGVVDGVLDFFRPAIRGLIALLLVIYNFNQFMGLIGQQSMTLGGVVERLKGGNSSDS